MANHARGEADLVIGGKTYAVGFINMGAVAEIASALGDDNMSYPDLLRRITAPGAADMAKIMMAALKSNGHDVSEEDVKRVDPAEYMKLVRALLSRPDDSKPDGGSGDARPTKRQKAQA